jgi:hypothetical protein
MFSSQTAAEEFAERFVRDHPYGYKLETYWWPESSNIWHLSKVKRRT